MSENTFFLAFQLFFGNRSVLSVNKLCISIYIISSVLLALNGLLAVRCEHLERSTTRSGENRRLAIKITFFRPLSLKIRFGNNLTIIIVFFKVSLR